jgi:lipopolysaccharide/colanic/teichoic acid biosynthesis glycosyltransferase
MYKIKRVMDYTFCLGAIILFFPIFFLIFFLVRILVGKPVIFRQERIGFNDQPFTLYKFKTMTERRDSQGRLLPDSERLTCFGVFLRNASLDELPELFNILKGDMSLVGPRPLYSRYLPFYTQQERLRHTVLPGLTGWAQIHGRNLIPWDERLALDVWYVKNWSILLDFKILFATFFKVILRTGVSADPDLVETDLDKERASAILGSGLDS